MQFHIYLPVFVSLNDNRKLHEAAERLKEGPEGLEEERRGRACIASGTMKGRKPKFEKQENEDLIAENQRLRAENDYLKNLYALVLEEERRQHKKHW